MGPRTGGQGRDSGRLPSRHRRTSQTTHLHGLRAYPLSRRTPQRTNRTSLIISIGVPKRATDQPEARHPLLLLASQGGRRSADRAAMSGRLEPDPRARPPPSRWGGVCAPSFRYQGQGAVPPTPPPPPTPATGRGTSTWVDTSETTSSVAPSSERNCPGGERMGDLGAQPPRRLPTSRRTGPVHDAGTAPDGCPPHAGCGEAGIGVEMGAAPRWRAAVGLSGPIPV